MAGKVSSEGIMLVALLFIFWLAYLYFGWPSRVVYHIKRNPGGGGENQGSKFMFVPFIAFITIYVALVILTGQREGSFDWQTPQTVLTAILITAAIFFTAMRFFPPTYYTAFLNVTDWQTGGFSMKRLPELTIEKDRWWPLFFVIHNIGITSWDNYRITIGLGDNFEVLAESDSVPASKTWVWKTINPRIMNNPATVALQATNVLVVGEPQTIRFLVRAKGTGEFKISVHVVISGRPGGSQKYLWLIVKDEEGSNEKSIKTPI